MIIGRPVSCILRFKHGGTIFMSKFSVILAAAGQSTRFNDPYYKKPFAILNSKAIWLHSADLFLKRPDVTQVILVISPDEREHFLSTFGANIAVLGIDVVDGGEQRADSVANALEKVDADCEFVAIHDAARPCIDGMLVDRIFSAVREHGAVIPAIAVNSTVKRSADGKTIDETVDRKGLFLAQTPQAYSTAKINEWYTRRGSFQPTDESQLAEHLGEPVTLVEGSPLNIKITTKNDLAFAKAALQALPKAKLDDSVRFDAPPNPFKDDSIWG